MIFIICFVSVRRVSVSAGTCTFICFLCKICSRVGKRVLHSVVMYCRCTSKKTDLEFSPMMDVEC